MTIGGRPVFPGPERVVRVGAALCGHGVPNFAGSGRAEGLDAIALPAGFVRFHTLIA